MNRSTLRRASVLAVALPTLVAGAAAADGRIEINHEIALVGGVTAGDAPGYPVTISATGSYHLSGDLLPPDAATTGIEVTGDYVTLDLGGFSILGPTTCTGAGPTLTCSALSSGDGISLQGDSPRVGNGAIVGAGNYGIGVYGTGHAQLHDLSIEEAAGSGIWVVPTSTFTLTRSIVQRVGATGVAANATGSIFDSQIVSNFSSGASLLGGVLTGSRFDGNGFNGASLASGVFRENVVTNNAVGLDGSTSTFASGYVRNLFDGNGSDATAVSLGDNLCDGSLC